MQQVHTQPIAEAVALSRTRALDDSDGATRQTVQKMCELIRDSARDPVVKQSAAYARDRFAMGSSDPAALAWGVFWYVKHSVKFRLDEGTMIEVGEPQQQDLLIAPAVLVRMKNPSEDCDGFTMLTAALLTCLGVPVVIATVATDMDDPSRWSHVFLCAIINSRVKPLDTSHGAAPGWMVPRNRINRWQTWTLDGQPADVKIPTYQGLHGYSRAGVGRSSSSAGRRIIPVPRIRGRGFGCLVNDPEAGWVDDGTGPCGGGGTPPVDPGPQNCFDAGGIYNPSTGDCTSPSELPTPPLPLTRAPSQSSYTPAPLQAIIAAGGNSAVSLIRTATGGPYTVAGTNLVYNPETGQLIGPQSSAGMNTSTLSASIMSNLPLIGGAVIVFLLISQMGKSR